MANDVYWLKDEADITIGELESHHGLFYGWHDHPIMQSWIRNHLIYYSPVLEPTEFDTSLIFQGEQGELIRMQIPQARSLNRQLISMITKRKLAFSAIAESEGSDVIQEVRLGNGLSQQIVETQSLDMQGERCLELSTLHGMAFMKASWRTDRGKPFAAEGKQEKKSGLVYDGDLEITVHDVFDVFFDYTIERFEELDWIEVRTLKNKWDLIEQHQDLKDDILSLPPANTWRSNQVDEHSSFKKNDLVWVYELYHKPTPSLPNGRLLIYGDRDTVFYDGENHYGCLPVSIMKPEVVQGTGFGYPIFANLLPAQEMLDHGFSAIATNQSALAVQNVTVPRSSSISVQEIGGMNYIYFDPIDAPGGGRPEALNLVKTAPETFKSIDYLLNHMQQISNVNSALRGEPPPGVTSGVAIATLSANAIEFLDPLSKAYNKCLEDIMMKAINVYRKFATIPHIVSMTGKNDQAFSKDFVGTDLDPIKRVKITITNPLMQTMAGRTEIAERLVQSGLIHSVQDYISVLDGAPTKVLYEDELSENDLVSSENEALLRGEDVIALSTDDHPTHIRKHAALLNDPKVRFNNDKVSAILEHILEHKELEETTDPSLKAMVRTGKKPEMPAQPAPQQLPPAPGEIGVTSAMPNEQTALPAEEGIDLLSRG